MTTEQQKAYDIGYKAATSGVAPTGKVMVDRTRFVTNNYSTFSNPSWANSEGYDYYVKGYSQAKADVTAATTSTPLPAESTLTNLIKSQYARLNRTYTSVDISNWLSQCANLWRRLDEPKNLDKLADKLVPMFNSLPPQAAAVVDNTQDYAPVIVSSTPETVLPTSITNPSATLPDNIADIFSTGVAQTPATTTTAPTITSISDVTDNALDYSPAIASTTDTPVSTDTTAAAVTEAGIGSNTLAIILLVGAAIGVLFAMFKGMKK